MLTTAREILNEGDRVAERSLGSVPGTLEFRLQRLEKSSAFLDRLLARYPDDEALIKDSAVSNFRSANVCIFLGRHDDAHRKLDKAESQFARLTELQPGNPDYRFDLFHCALTRSYLNPDPLNQGNSNPIDTANQIISELVNDYPEDLRYLDALLCARLRLLDYREPSHEKSIEEIYHAAVKLKANKATPCLEWRHAGTTARLLALAALERLDLDTAVHWLPIARDATQDFLKRPDTVLDDQLDWMIYLEAASKLATLRGDHTAGEELRTQWRSILKTCGSEMPDRPAFSTYLQQENIIFDEWLSKAQDQLLQRVHGVTHSP
jgi:tetratricopeptide (TPR) repeat protein